MIFILFFLLNFHLWARKKQNRILTLISKPSLCGIMLYYVIYESSLKNIYLFQNNEYLNHIVYGLIFSIIGDIFLVSSRLNLFMLGILNFMIAHINYMIAISNDQCIPIDRNNIDWIQYHILDLSFKIVISLVLIYIILDLFKNLDKNLRIPVIIYACILYMFGIYTFEYYIICQNYRSLFMFIGSWIFIGSDIILAYDKFIYRTERCCSVMSLYIIGQYFITQSVNFD